MLSIIDSCSCYNTTPTKSTRFSSDIYSWTFDWYHFENTEYHRPAELLSDSAIHDKILNLPRLAKWVATVLAQPRYPCVAFQWVHYWQTICAETSLEWEKCCVRCILPTTADDTISVPYLNIRDPYQNANTTRGFSVKLYWADILRCQWNPKPALQM